MRFKPLCFRNDDSDYNPDDSFISKGSAEEIDTNKEYFSLSGEKKYPSDEQTFIVYESQLLQLLQYCMKCGGKILYRNEMKNTGSQLILHLKCEKGKYSK